MKNSLHQNTTSDIFLRRRLYAAIASFVIIIGGLVGIGMSGMYILSGMRSFVGAEGLWSKNQKSAVVHLLLYAANRDPYEYDQFNKYLAVPLGNKQARLELEKAAPDMDRARQGLIVGGNHPLDAAGMANLFRWFRDFEHIDRAINIWARADTLIDALTTQAEQLHEQMKAGDQVGNQEREATITEILKIDEQLTILEDEFSIALGDASRWAKGLLSWVMIGAGAVAILASTVAVLFIGKMYSTMQLLSEERARQSEALASQSEILAAKNMLAEAGAGLDELLRRDLPVTELCEKTVCYVAEYLKVPVGAIYVNNGEDIFIFGAGYVFCPPAVDEKFAMGEGLIGQAALERKMIVADRLPEGYLQISSGLGSGTPATVLLMPLVYNEKVAGVLALGAYVDFSEAHKNFVEQAAPVLAIALNSARSRLELQKALETSQQLTEEMGAQQEELRAANEELDEQTQRLRASEEELQAQQEELRAANEELVERNRLLEKNKSV